MKKIRNIFTVQKLLLVGVFIASAVFSYFCVWTHDDFFTHISPLRDMLRASLFFGNGRYIGNFIVDIFLSYKLLDTLVRASSITVIIALTASVAAGLNIKTILLSFALFFGLGNFIFGEAVIWGHGFYNFVPPVALILIALQILKSIYLGRHRKFSAGKCACLLLLGVAQQLFSENTTCIAMLIALTVFIAVVYKREPKAPGAFWFIGSAIGTFLMFGLPELMHVSYKMQDYRGQGVGAESMQTFTVMFIRNLRSGMTSLAPMFIAWGLLSYAMFMLLKRWPAVTLPQRLKKTAFQIVLALFPAVSLFYLIINGRTLKHRIPFTNIRLENPQEVIKIAVLACFAVYLICVVLVLCGKKTGLKNRRLTFLILLICILSFGELLIITVMGPRCLFITACILSVFILKLLQDEAVPGVKITTAAGAAGLIACIVITAIMHGVWTVNNVRFAYARKQLAEGKEIIEIIRLPHEKWMHCPNESAGYGWYFNYGEPKPEEDYTYVTYEEYLNRNAD